MDKQIGKLIKVVRALTQLALEIGTPHLKNITSPFLAQ